MFLAKKVFRRNSSRAARRKLNAIRAPHIEPHASRAAFMEFEFIHDAFGTALKPLRDVVERFVLDNSILALVVLCVVPLGLIILLHDTERAVDDAQRTLDAKKRE